LNSAGVKYMVAGGIAVNLYGIERSTADIDILLLLSDENLSRFIEVVRQLGLKPKIPEPVESLRDVRKRHEWREEKNLAVFSLYDPKVPFFLLDVLIEPPFDFDEVYGRRNDVGLGDLSIPLVPLLDLIEMKERSGRPQDVADAYHLRELMRKQER
jgi:hypothetical protein